MLGYNNVKEAVPEKREGVEKNIPKSMLNEKDVSACVEAIKRPDGVLHKEEIHAVTYIRDTFWRLI